MKKISMGMMLSSLLLIQIGCGEEAPDNAQPAPAGDPAAMMHSATDAAAGAHDAAKEDAKEGADAAKEGADDAKEGADAAKEGADAAKEVAP